jgi:hypothetical protein
MSLKKSSFYSSSWESLSEMFIAHFTIPESLLEVSLNFDANFTSKKLDLEIFLKKISFRF